MHELSLALSLLDEVDATAAREGATRVASVHLRLGRMSGIAKDALIFSWDLARAGTVAADAALVIEEIPLAVWCERCGGERPVREGDLLICAECGAASSSIVHGRELQLVAMEVG
jgi:hydrogenase nickel incorporation protein HypA/HybF